MLSIVILLLFCTFHLGSSQINLGSFNLQPRSNGIWDMSFNQGGSILGFGAERGGSLSFGKDFLGLGGNQGAVVAGERVGSQSQFGVSQGGINLGSNVNFGEGEKRGDLNSFIKGIGDFFKNLAPPPSHSPPSFPPSEGQTSPPMEGEGHREEKGEEQLVLMNERPAREEGSTIHLDHARESSVRDDDHLLHDQ